MPGKETHELELLLTLNDQWSKGLAAVEKALSKLDERDGRRRRQRGDNQFAARMSRGDEAAARQRMRLAQSEQRQRDQQLEREQRRQQRAAEAEQGRVDRRVARGVDQDRRAAEAQERRQQRSVEADERRRQRAVEADRRRQQQAQETEDRREQRRDEQSAGRARREEERRRREGGGVGRFFDRGDRLLMGARGIGSAWRDQAEGLRRYTDAYLDLAQARAKFSAIGLSHEENEKAFAAVSKVVSDLGGVSAREATETITDLHTALGNLDHAIEALPLASKYRFSFKTLFGDKYSDEQLEEQIQNSFKFLEVTGSVARGREPMERMFDVMTQMQAATGGRVTPAELLQTARKGGPALQGLSEQWLRNLSAPIQELGAEGTGSALMSTYQALVAGVMKQSAAMEFQRLGLLDPKKIQFGKAQQIKKVMPGGNRLGAQVMEDPLAAADTLMEAMKAHGIDTSNANKVREELSILFQNRRAFSLMSLYTTQRGQVVKESGLSDHAPGNEELRVKALDSALAPIKKFEAAWEDMRAKIGEPLVVNGTQLAAGLMPLFELAAKHPYIVAGLVGIKSGFGGVIETGYHLKQLGLFDVFSRGRASIASATDETARFRSSLTSLPSVVKTAVMVGGVALAIDQLIALQQQYSKTQQWFRDQADQNTVDFQSWTERQAERGRTGQETPRSEVMGEALKAWRALNPDDALVRSIAMQGFGQRVEALWGAYRPYGSRWDIVTPSGLFEPERAAPIFKKSAPMLEDPKIMGEFLKKTQNDLKVSGSFWGFEASTVKAQMERFNQALTIAFPDSYRAAMQAQQQEEARLAEESKDTNAALKHLPPTLERLDRALGSFSLRVSGLDLNLPTPGGAITGGGAQPPAAPRRNRFLQGYDPFGFFDQTGYVERPKGRQMGPAAEVPRGARAAGPREDFFQAARVGRSSARAQLGERVEAARLSIMKPIRALQPAAAGGGVHIGSMRIAVTVPAGSRAADNPRELARFVSEEVSRQMEEQFDSRRIVDLVSHEMEIQNEWA